MKSSKTNKKSKTKQSLNTQILYLTVFTVLVIAAVAGTTYFIQQRRIDKLADTRSKLIIASATPNSACLGLGNSVWKRNYLNSFKLDARQTYFEGSKSTEKLVSICNIGGNTSAVTKTANVAKVDKDGLDFGIKVIYFPTANAASEYGNKVINPQRYWTVQDGNLTADLPMWHYFYSYVFDGNFPYFDAYAVKGNSFLRVTLPCGDKRNPDLVVKTCSATDTLKSFSEAIPAIALPVN